MFGYMAELRESNRTDQEAAKLSERHIVVWYGQIGLEWVVSLQIEPGIRRRISSHRDKVEAVLAANHAADHRGLDMRIIEPEPATT